MHDRTLMRTTDGHGRIRGHRLERLRRLDAAFWWRPGAIDDHTPGAAHPLRHGAEDCHVASLDGVAGACAEPATPTCRPRSRSRSGERRHR